MRRTLALALACAIAACGVRTPPRPPEQTEIRTGRPKVERTAAGEAKVRWKRPKASADGQRLYDLVGFVVERRADDGEFVSVGIVPVTDNERVRPQQTFIFVDATAPAGTAEYRVWAFDSYDQHGRPSPVALLGESSPAVAPDLP